MAHIVDAETPLKGGNLGICHPVLQHKWAIWFPNLPEDVNEVLRLNAISCKLNLAKRTFQITVEQPRRVAGIFGAINMMAGFLEGCGVQIQIEHMDGATEIDSFVRLEGDLDDHSYELDYSKSETAKQILTFKNIRLLGDNISDTLAEKARKAQAENDTVEEA